MTATAVSAAPTTTWAIDPAHSLVEFGVKHLMISTVKGRFGDVKGTVTAGDDTFRDAVVDMSIGVASVDTRQPDRDTHLRSADFFDVETFPAMTFKSTRVEPLGDDSLRVVGQLTIRDTTKEVVLNVTPEGRGPDPWGGERAGFSATAKINRRDFGLTWNQVLETGGFVVGDEIKILDRRRTREGLTTRPPGALRCLIRRRREAARMCTLARSYALSAIIAVAVAVPATATAQVLQESTQVPPRDRISIPATGTGVIRGRVVDGVSGAAVPRARVRVMGGGPQRPSVTTDADGRFEFTKLPAGTFTLAVEKATYMLGRYPDAGRTLRTMGRPLLLRAGESIDSIAIPLFRGAAISGHVMDASGDLVESAQVALMRLSPGGRPTMRNSTSTNDLGEFRLGKLEPGSYVLLATARRFGPGEPVPVDVEPPPQPLPTYYPGVAAIDLAQPVRVARGQAVGDTDITLTESVPAVLSGTVIGEDGQPLKTGGFITVRAMIKDLPYPIDMFGSSLGPDGTFRLAVAPGDYVVEARAMSSGSGVDRMGLERVSIAGNVEGLTIQIGRAATASGRVIFEGTSPVPSDPQQVRFQLFTSDGESCRQGRMSVSADWSFTIEGLGGTCAVTSQSGIGRWMLKTLQIGGQDVDGQSLTFEPGQQIRNLEAVFTDRRTSVTFHVAGERGQATREYVALMFPVTRERVEPSSVRTLVPPPDELLAAAAALTPGRARSEVRRETMPGLRPGEYYAVAIDDISTEDVRDPSVLARLVPAATRVTVGEGADVQVVLRRQVLADILNR